MTHPRTLRRRQPVKMRSVALSTNWLHPPHAPAPPREELLTDTTYDEAAEEEQEQQQVPDPGGRGGRKTCWTHPLLPPPDCSLLPTPQSQLLSSCPRP